MLTAIVFILGGATGAGLVLLLLAGPGAWPAERRPLKGSPHWQERDSWLR